MPSLPVRLSEEATDEARSAYAWYAYRNPHAAQAFLRELDDAIESIAETPNAWPHHVGGTRRKLFTRFPFSLIYRETAGSIEVVAVAHQRRRPGYWADR